MIEPWPPADVSVLEELFSIQKERKILAERLARLEEERAKISAVVYERVHRDYASQYDKLVERAAPLKERARRGHAEAQGALAVAEEKLGAARLDREELEVRHRLGEFAQEELETRLAAADEIIQGLERELGEIAEVKASFLAAFDSEEELLQAAPAAESVVEAATQVSLRLEPLPPPPPLPPSLAPSAADALDEALRHKAMADTGSLEESAAEGVTMVIATTSPAPPMPPGASAWPQPARLVPADDPPGAAGLRVEPLTTIGRIDQNQIQIADSAVSRHHARIVLSEEGYVLEDLKSENGTFVNGQRIAKQLLIDGDRVQIGTMCFVFKRT